MSQQTFDNVLSWMEKCTIEHQACGPGEKFPLPRRVLDLMVRDEEVLLYESDGREARYMCLSHCWGNSRALTTTLTNIENHKKGIPFEALPRTFQDAVLFCRKMKIRYLWIDSLCIIQDDEEDWQRESALMAQIYQHSYLTLAATASHSDEEGLFYTSPQAHVFGVLADGAPYQMHARPAIRHFDDAKFPLFSRAWIFQERMLAPRVLHFGEQELWWECMEALKCECGGINSGERLGSGQAKYESKIAHQRIVSTASLAYLTIRWHTIIEEYSELNLTKSRDKLTALSGIADQMFAIRESRQIRHRRVHHSPDRKYLAGLWSDTIVSDLLWFRKDHTTTSFPERWRAPSWSWAALDGPVTYWDTVGRNPTDPDEISPLERRASGTLVADHHVQVIVNSTRLAGANQFGEILGANLRLQGQLLPVHLTRGGSRYHGNRFEFRYFNQTRHSVPFFADYELSSFDLDRKPVLEDTKGYLLRLMTDEQGHEYALVLRKASEDSDMYERIGLFRTNNLYPGAANQYREHFKGAQQQTELTLL